MAVAESVVTCELGRVAVSVDGEETGIAPVGRFTLSVYIRATDLSKHHRRIFRTIAIIMFLFRCQLSLLSNVQCFNLSL